MEILANVSARVLATSLPSATVSPFTLRTGRGVGVYFPNILRTRFHNWEMGVVACSEDKKIGKLFTLCLPEDLLHPSFSSFVFVPEP